MRVMRTPKSLDLSITSRCNLRCKYCSHFSSAGDVAKDLAIGEWLDFFEELRDLAVMDVCLQGGEPFLRDDFADLVSGIVKNRMRFSVLTNGTLVDERLARFLISTKRCDYVQVSLDGSRPSSHDVMRGDGSFELALNGLRTLKAYNVPLMVRVTIHKQNLRDLEAIAHLLLDELALSSFGINSASHMGLCRANKDEVQLSPEEHLQAMETLLKLLEKYPSRINAAAGPLADARTWLAMEKARLSGAKQLPNGGYLTACGGVISKLAVRSDGVIVPCLQLGHIELGRINRDPLCDIWRSHTELEKLRERRFIPLSDFAYCKDCEYIPYCTGNCPALAYTILGKENHPSPNACLRRFLEEGGSLPAEINLVPA